LNLELLVSFGLATALLALSPGPDNIYVLVVSLNKGKAKALATVSGLISGCIIHTTLLAFGVSKIIINNDQLFLTVKVFGALYLLFLAYKTYTSNEAINLSHESLTNHSMIAQFVKGFFMNVLNPKVMLFFLAFFPSFLFSQTMSTLLQFYVLGFIFMAVSFVIFSGIALLAQSIKSFTLSHKGAPIFFKWLQIIVFVGIAIFILI